MHPALFIILMLTLFSCKERTTTNQNKSGDTVLVAGVVKDSIPKTTVQFHISPAEERVNLSLSGTGHDTWHVLNDREAKWIKDAFEYFIVPKRKEEPNYPYICFGDYNGDGKTDTAAVVTNEKRSEFRLALLLSDSKPFFWKEDMMTNAAISTIPKGEAVEAGTIDYPKKLKMKVDGVNVEYFEQGSFVVYQSGKTFKRIQQGD